MTTRVSIEWEPGSSVTGWLSGPSAGDVGVLLAHGAGAGQGHPFMVGLRDRLGAAGYPTLTFDYPYTEAGRRAPDRLPRLLECHRAALTTMLGRTRQVVLAGKSMGGRVGGHLAALDDRPAGLIFYGYPLVAMGKTEPRDTSHLQTMDRPMLFLQGERDRLGPIDLVRPMVAAIPGARLITLPEGDHSFRVPKRSGLDADDVADLLAGWTIGFLEEAVS